MNAYRIYLPRAFPYVAVATIGEAAEAARDLAPCTTVTSFAITADFSLPEGRCLLWVSAASRDVLTRSGGPELEFLFSSKLLDEG